MSLDFRDRLEIAYAQGRYAHALARLIVCADPMPLIELTSEPGFDQEQAFDAACVNEHVDHMEKRR